MSEVKTHTILHIEDEASNWRALPRALRNTLYDVLDPETRVTLTYTPPMNKSDYPAKWAITWKQAEESAAAHYWLIESASVSELRDYITTDTTFIIDVMRPDQYGILKSSLALSMSSISEYVTDWNAQVRVFSAFAIPEADVDSEHPLRLIKKSDTSGLLHFILQRLGIFTAGGRRPPV
jgi:hypothetical protein